VCRVTIIKLRKVYCWVCQWNFFYRWTFGKVTSKNVHGCLVHFVRLVAKRRRKCTRQPLELVTFVNDPTVWIFSWLIGTYSIQENGYAHAGLRKGEKFDKMTRRPVTGRQTDMWLQITIAEQNRILLFFYFILFFLKPTSTKPQAEKLG